ncbi:hypothetical protein DIPPA_17644 [Diplonema papillatum]|nr:hypothetical protein DIPPA_17644 [Diplonema papillatum]
MAERTQNASSGGTLKKLIKVYSIAVCAGSGVYSLFHILNGDFPKPKLQWTILFLYLVPVCLLGVAAELGFTKAKFINKYAMFLNHPVGRAFMYTLIGCLYFPVGKGWEVLFAILMWAAAALNIFVTCQSTTVHDNFGLEEEQPVIVN